MVKGQGHEAQNSSVVSFALLWVLASSGYIRFMCAVVTVRSVPRRAIIPLGIDTLIANILVRIIQPAYLCCEFTMSATPIARTAEQTYTVCYRMLYIVDDFICMRFFVVNISGRNSRQ